MPSSARNSSRRTSPGCVAVRLRGIISSPLVVVSQSAVQRRAVAPPKDDPPLVIHSNTPENCQAAAQLLKVVRRRSSEIVDIGSHIQQVELSYGARSQIGGKATIPVSVQA